MARSVVSSLLFLLLVAPGGASAADSVELLLKLNNVEVYRPERKPPPSLGGAPCISFELGVDTAVEAASGRASGRRSYAPIRIVKALDKSSALLHRGLVGGQVADGMAVLLRQRPDGTWERAYTVEFRGRIASLRQFLPSRVGPETANLPMLEEVTFAIEAIKLTPSDGGVPSEDSARPTAK